MNTIVRFVLPGLVAFGILADRHPTFGQDATAAGPKAASPVVYFHTEFFPYQQPIADPSAHHLSREFVRQALIATACNEFGLPVLDESLGESVPLVGQVIHLALLERASWKTKQWQVKLFAWDESQTDFDTSQLWNQTPLWQATYDWPGSIYVFNRLAPVFDVASKGEFTDALKQAGLTPRTKPSSDPVAVPDEVVQLLDNVDFVSQYRAMQLAHQALGEHGQSPEWLEVLVRSYANLSMLTQHHWSTTSEVFAARSFLYAQRLNSLCDSSARALAHRAYAWAVGGIHAHALSDLQKIAKLQVDNVNQSNDPIPEWLGLVQSYCECDRPAVRQFGSAHPRWQAWSARLEFFLTYTYGYSDGSGESLNESMQSCPTDFGIYAAMTRTGCALGVQRTGAYMAPTVFAKYLEESLGNQSDLPSNVQASLAPAPGSILEKWGLFRNAAQAAGPFSDLPSRIAKQLRIASEMDNSRFVSWSLLATLIEEELFIEATNYLTVSRNATEHSQTDVVKQLMPLLKEHRYASYIESYRFNRVQQFEEFKQSLTNLKIVDPSRSMYDMLLWIAGAKNPAGESIRDRAYAATERDFTVQGLYEYCFFMTPSFNDWIPQPKTSFASRLAEEMAKISPKLELGTRMAIGVAEESTAEQLKEWETKLRDDGDSYVLLARLFYERKLQPDALRCYNKALELKPDYTIAQELANFHYASGSAEAWESTLQDFIDTSSGQGLAEYSAHNDLAKGLYYLRNLQGARQHAVAAAESYSAWGLKSAAMFSEMFAEWEEAEGYFQALSESYPSYSSESWFFYCCRTGRGDRPAALQVAERYFTKKLGEQTTQKLLLFACFEFMRDDPQQALAYASKALEKGNSEATFLVAELARSTGKPELAAEVLAKLEEQINQYQSGPQEARNNAQDALAQGQSTLIGLIRSGVATEDDLQSLNTNLLQISENYRTRLAYHVGVELERQGKLEEAVTFFRRPLTLLRYDEGFASLCGLRLCNRLGTSRPDNQPFTEDDLWINRRNAEVKAPPAE